MTEPSKDVFLSYASQDAEAASRIGEALRAVGIEVWFDQSELRGGDAWDRQIRKQIHDCALFIPIISANTQARPEGYFRLEWKLAVERTHLMSDRVAFLVPVVIDDTGEAQADVPEPFRTMQWTRLPAGNAPPAFVARIAQLLSRSEPHSAQARPLTAAPAARPHNPGAVASRGSKLVPSLIAAVALMVGGYFALDKFILSKRASATAQVSAPTAQVVPPVKTTVPEKSIAVLPFVDMSEKKDQEYFSDGLSEELIDLLTQVEDLRVPARTSSFYFKGQHATIAEIAKTLGVSHVLEGSVRKSGNTLRVTAQLIRAENGYHLWSQTYDRALKDIFKVQDEIAADVVAALKIKLLPQQQQPRNHRRTDNLEAYTQYLLGKQHQNRDNLEGYRGAVRAFGRAVALDTRYAAAWAGLAMAEYLLADNSNVSLAETRAGKRRAEQAAENAITLEPDLVDGYAARGFVHSIADVSWAAALADLEKARALNPADSDVQLNYAVILATVGRLAEAVEAIRQATELDPLSSRAWRYLGWFTLGTYRGEPERLTIAREALTRATEINQEANTSSYYLGIVQLVGGDPQGALTTFRQSSQGYPSLGAALAEHTLGHPAESQHALNEAIASEGISAAYQIAEVYAWRGEKDKAFSWLERAYTQEDGALSFVKYDPLLRSLRDDPRYKALLRKMNLPER